MIFMIIASISAHFCSSSGKKDVTEHYNIPML